MGLSIGVTAMVARRIGEGSAAGAAEAAVQGIALGLLVAALIAVVGVPLATRLLAVMGATPAVQAGGPPPGLRELAGHGRVGAAFLSPPLFRRTGVCPALHARATHP